MISEAEALPLEPIVSVSGDRARRTILLVAYGRATNLEGYHRRVLLMARTLSDLGHNVVLLWFVTKWGAFASDLGQLVPKSISVVRVPTLPLFFSRPLALLGRALDTLVARVVYSLFGCNAVQAETELCASLARLCPACFFVVDYHGDTLAERKLASAEPWKLAASRDDASVAMRKATAIITASEELARHTLKMDRPSPDAVIEVLPCVVDLTAFVLSEPQRRQKRAAIGVGDRIVVCYCGGLQLWQSFDKVLSLVTKIRREDPRIYFLLITNDSLRPFADALARIGERGQDYELVSAAPDEVPGWLVGADVGLLLREDSPVNRVASPTKFAEYLAAGLPVIATQYAGDAVSKIVEDRCGFVMSDVTLRREEEAGLAAFLEDVVADRSRWAQHVRHVAERCYDGAQAANRLRRCYELQPDGSV